jgi:glycosyltransferase involved in cell wall biosynthesis
MVRHRIKILFAIGTLDIGGAERQLVELASRLDPDRFEAVVCVLGRGGPLGAVLRDRGVKVHYLGLGGAGNRGSRRLLLGLLAIVRLWAMMRRERPTVFHGVLFAAYVTGTAAAAASGVPIVVASRRSLGHFKAGKRLYLLVERLNNRMTDLLIANSEAVRQDVIAQEGVDPKKVVVIYNGLDVELYGHPDESVNLELQLGNGPVILVVANFIEYKGHAFFFDAWRDVVSRHPQAVAILAGDGGTRSHWEEWCRNEGLMSSVRFVGTRHDVPRLLAAADLYVHPSLEEGYSNAVLEAMATSLPIVATAVGGNVEAIEHERTGLLVAARDAAGLETAMNRLLEDPLLARRLGEAARSSVVARHQFSGMVREYELVYKRLVGCSPTDKGSSHVWDRRSV